jgi:predicted esterase
MNFSRRKFCAVAGSTVASVAIGNACHRAGGSEIANEGSLSARPQEGVKTKDTGRLMLGLTSERDAILQLPKTASQSLPLLLMLHGATQSADTMLRYLGSIPEAAGVAVLAPNSRDITWDGIRDGFGPDVEVLNRALEKTFKTAAIDPARVSIGGFSDGASYALSLGLINADLFSSVLAFSPGFIVEGVSGGRMTTPPGKNSSAASRKPRFFISHGTHDHILPIENCGRRIAADLKGRGYDVTFHEFDGDHELPGDIAREAMKFVTATKQ